MRTKGRLLISLCAVAPMVLGSVAAGADNTTNLTDRMDRLEARLQQVESQVTQLRQEKQAVQAQLDHQKQEDAALKARLDAPASSGFAASKSPAASDAPHLSKTPTSEWGTRVGYQEFPYHQRHGGFYYGFYFDHALAQQADGIPFGDLDADITIGISRSDTDHVNDFSDALLEKAVLEYRQTMLSGWIGIKYQLNQWAPLLRPYVIAGPGIWGDVVESPPLFIGEQNPSKALKVRKLPVDAAANLYEGGQGGAGFELNLASTGIKPLERVNLGFDYRYSAWTTGEQFATYTFSLSASE
ncbi:MAG TPA: hypothetical protein VKB84_13150 [Candidatus Binataceae bacterium]|nr:hypothetical protein [Candidatus Binataceae bacterium]